MIYRSKAPLRIGLAGGGTDVSPYSDTFGGAVVNATISLYAHASIEPIIDNAIIVTSLDQKQEQRFDWAALLPLNGQLDLLKGVYNRIHANYGVPLTGFRLSTFVDVPVGSGLGTSSTLVVAIVGAFVEMLRLPLGDYDIARLAYLVEREDLQLAGGRQDQYAATFGGVNFMEFNSNEKVIVNPLKVRPQYLQELAHNLVLYFTNTSRNSDAIIREQAQHVRDNDLENITAMHKVKEQAYRMKEALLKGRIDEVGELLDLGFQHKRNMAKGISNEHIETIYSAAKAAGATGGKISGAGGGGFIVFYCPGNTRYKVIEALQLFDGNTRDFSFTPSGVTSWTI